MRGNRLELSPRRLSVVKKNKGWQTGPTAQTEQAELQRAVLAPEGSGKGPWICPGAEVVVQGPARALYWSYKQIRKTADFRCTEANLRKEMRILRSLRHVYGCIVTSSRHTYRRGSDCKCRFGCGCKRGPWRGLEHEWDGACALEHIPRLCFMAICQVGSLQVKAQPCSARFAMTYGTAIPRTIFHAPSRMCACVRLASLRLAISKV